MMEADEAKVLYKPHAEDKVGSLTRQKAIRRKGNTWNQTLSRPSGEKTEPKEETPPDDEVAEDRRRPDGSSLDLAPTLLNIYDNIAAANGSTDPRPGDQIDARCKSKSLPASVTVRHSSVVRTDSEAKLNQAESKMADEIVCKVDSVDGDIGKKRPLSISSSSSASSSSLSRPQHKRPNLADYEHLLTTKSVDNSFAKNEDLNGNCQLSKTDYISTNVHSEDKMEGVEECLSSNKLSVTSACNIQTAVVDNLELNHCSPPVLASRPPVIPPSPTVSSPDFSPEKVTSSHSKSSPGESSSPSDSPVKPDTGQNEISFQGDTKTVSQTKSPPSSLGCQLSPSSRSRTSPVSSMSPVNGCKDTSSPEGNKGSLYVSYVQRVVAEIVDTERIYVKSLEDIIKGYLEFLEKSTKVKQEDIKCLFSNIRDIYDFGRHFLWELEQCDGDPVKVAECFVTNNKGFVIYTDYCTNYPSAVEVLTRCMMDPHLSEMFKRRQHSLGHGLPLGAYLLRPVQRILKYHLLLQNILKFFDKEKDGYEMLNKAFKHMTEMAHHINEMKRKHEHAVRIQEIQSQLEDYGGEDLTRLGELVLEGPFRVYGAKASRQVFLFEREILISKKKEGGMLGCKASIQLANLMLVEVIPNEPLSFHLIPFDNPRAQFTLQARNMEQKRRWCQEIKRLILDTYKGKIPDKVKSLVMELGRNHDDDYVNSENLDPRRSHHTAPEYLEKRRGRRKSGGRLPDLLKPQKAKRGSSGTRKGDISPKTSPLMERRQTHPTLMPTRQRETTYLQKSQQSVNDCSIDGTTTQSDIPSHPGVPKDPSKSETCRSAEKQDETVLAGTEVAADSVRRAKSFRMATRMRPINSLDMSDMKRQTESDSDSDMDDPNVIKDGLKEYSNVVLGTQSDIDDFSDEEKPRKGNQKSRYSSMPILNITPPQSPQVKSDPIVSNNSAEDTTSGNSWNKPKQDKRTSAQPKRWNNVMRNDQGKRIPAFHDTFAKKSRDNLSAKSLRHPVYNVKHLSVDSEALSKQCSNAKLTNWGSSEKLTKGSMSDLSHLSEDPWVKNTDTKKLSGSVSVTNGSKPQVPKLKTSNCSENKNGSRENMDWMVYVNRNSLGDTENQKYFSKYCSTSKGVMTPPKSPTVLKHEHQSPKLLRSDNGSVSNTQVRPVSTYDIVPDIPKVSLASSVPSIIVSSTSPRYPFTSHLAQHLNRSNSTPLTKAVTPIFNKRPSSLDCDTYTDSEKMVAEMEDYMKHSESSSSLTNKFPTNLPTFYFSEHDKGNRHSNISTSSYESHSSSSSEGIMDTLKNKIHHLTSKISRKVDDIDTLSGVSSVSDPTPSSVQICEDEKLDDAKSKDSSSETLDSSQRTLKKQQQLLDEDEELRTFLRERGLGGGSIGSRMANSLPPNVEALITEKLRPHSACVLRDNESVSSYELSSKETTPEPQPRLSLPIMQSTENLDPVPLNQIDVQQSDSGFSMQSDVTDAISVKNSVSNEDITLTTPKMEVDETDGNKDNPLLSPNSTENTLEEKSPVTMRRQSESSADSVDSFYERRLSIAFDSEVFRDSAVFCEIEIDPKQKVVKEVPKRPKRSIRDFVQILEERNRPKPPQTMEVKRRQPGSVIRQRLHTLQQASHYSRSSSRNPSEEREILPPKSVKDIQQTLVNESRSGHHKSWYHGTTNMCSINSSSNTSISSISSGSYTSGVSGPHFAVVGGGNQFVHHRAESEHGRESSPEMGGIRPARSLGRLDQLSNEIENLVIMKGWVRSLINRFQNDKE